MPGTMSSYRLCMIPSSPIRGRAGVTPESALAVDVLVAVMAGLDVVGVERRDVAEHAREVHRAGDVLAHHGRLDGVAWPGPHGEHAVGAHQHGGGTMVLQRLDDAVADLLVADQRERADGDLAAELVG